MLRAVEMEGTRTQTPVEFVGGRGVFRVANLLEEVTGSTEEQMLRVQPYEICTVRLPLK